MCASHVNAFESAALLDVLVVRTMWAAEAYLDLPLTQHARNMFGWQAHHYVTVCCVMTWLHKSCHILRELPYFWTVVCDQVQHWLQPWLHLCTYCSLVHSFNTGWHVLHANVNDMLRPGWTYAFDAPNGLWLHTSTHPFMFCPSVHPLIVAYRREAICWYAACTNYLSCHHPPEASWVPSQHSFNAQGKQYLWGSR